ncbi:MAG: 6-hydroxymethylpterin diphosphokinase MptE-like protein [Spirochaetaceae bacterium]
MPHADLSLEETSDGFQVRYRGRGLYTPSGPVAGARRRAEAAPLPEDTLFLVPSPLLGYGLPDLLRRLPDSSHLFCVEVDPSLGTLAETAAGELGGSDRITFFFPRETGSVPFRRWQDTASTLVTKGFRRVRTITLNGGASLHRDKYRAVERELEEAIQQTWQNRMTTIRLGRLWGRNFLVNLGRSAFAGNADCLRESKPIVVVGPSESLEEEIAYLLPVRNRVALLALDTALPALGLRNVVPDYVVSVDSQQTNALDFVGALRGGFTLIAETTVHPSIPRFAGLDRTYWISSQGFETGMVRRAEEAGLLPLRLPPIGSVAVAAVLMGLRMTSQNVYLMGIDLTYAPGKPYATGAPLHIEELSTNHRLAPERMLGLSYRRPLTREKSIAGAVVQTDLVLLSYRHQLRTLLEGSRRVSTVGTRGLDLGVPALTGPDLAAGTEFDGEPRRPVPESPGDRDNEDAGDTPRRERLRAFLEENLALLKEAKKRPVLESPEVQAWDHAWFDFPEAQTGRGAGPTFGPRLSLRLERYGRLVEGLLDASGPGSRREPEA